MSRETTKNNRKRRFIRFFLSLLFVGITLCRELLCVTPKSSCEFEETRHWINPTFLSNPIIAE
ncbi:CLUMA_CG013982, isoform A [Clunio marinus]|uniref:CLUMA_CG013982, isoform A n=1 Tax=Clunio marinus TaxID=568069 RepID=A0A1J1IKF0_9DIPT|nr:CLUMA_CG013982, isoform A [Clunio marinus]